MSDLSFTTNIDSQEIVFEFHGTDPEPLKAALNQMDLLRAALQVQAALTMKNPHDPVEVDLEKLQEWFSDRDFNIDATEILNDLLGESGITITEFAIQSSGQFAIALKVKFQDPFDTDDLPAEIRQIIRGPEIGLGMARAL
jgi:hypothetical protein